MQLCMQGNALACIRQRSVHRASNSSTQTDSEVLGTDLMPGTASVCCCITRSSRLVEVTVMSDVPELDLIWAAIASLSPVSRQSLEIALPLEAYLRL